MLSWYDNEIQKWDIWARKMKALSIFVDMDFANCTNCKLCDLKIQTCDLDKGPSGVNENTICPEYKTNLYSLN